MFSVGNVITLLVVVSILAIYRQLDRNNRALDKVKRYADRVTGELAGFIGEKSTEIKDLAIEIQVGLKTGKELLKRVRMVEEGLEGRATQMDDIEHRLNGYDATLGTLVDMSDRVDENLRRIRDESTFITGVGKEVRQAAQQLHAMRAEYPKLQEELHAQDRRELLAIHQQVMEDAERRAGAVAADFVELETHANQMSAGAKSFGDRVSELESVSLAELANQAQNITDTANQALEAAHGRAAKLEDLAFAALRTRIDDREEELSSRLQQLQGSLARATDEHQELATNVLAVQADFEATAQQLTEGLAQRSSALESSAVAQLEESGAQIEVTVTAGLADIERTALASAASRLEEHEVEVGGRLQRIESQQSDFIAFETSFRQVLEEKTVVLRDVIEQRSARLLEDHATQLENVKTRFGATETGLADLERNVAELKARTHRDMSDRLEAFEKDFFADLSSRSGAMTEQVDGWQVAVAATLEQLSRDMRTQAEQARTATAGELQAAIEALRERSGVELDRVESSLARFEEGLLERLRGSETIISEQHGLAREQLHSARAELAESYTRSVADVRDQLDHELDDATRNLSARIGSLDQESRDQAAALRESGAESRGGIELQLAQLQQSFQEEKSELIDGSAEERDRLRMELRALGDGVDHLGEEILLKTAGAAQEFGDLLREHEAGFRRRVDGLLDEFVATSDRQRDTLATLKREAETEHAQLLGKMQTEAQGVTGDIATADRKLKAFVDQTRLFERADSLRAELEQRTTDLEQRITTIQAQQESMEQLQSDLGKARKIGEEVAAKLTRFQAEKRRIESMEGDFRKLIAVSRDVDNKLGSIESNQDSLQEIQLKIRQLQDLEQTVESDYERLEKRRDVLDTTVTSVDKSFQRLDELEASLTTLAPGIDQAAGQLGELQKKVDVLGAGKDRADRAIKMLSQMDTVMAELETRMATMQGARDWLARTETRFEEISQQAEDQVGLLEALTKKEIADADDEGASEGAPSGAKRDTVVKLARNGWSVQEIAKATRLSRGEVELILEVNGSRSARGATGAR
jgi:DNA repair exonuclease SbcCD ATPase subunit